MATCSPWLAGRSRDICFDVRRRSGVGICADGCRYRTHASRCRAGVGLNEKPSTSPGLVAWRPMCVVGRMCAAMPMATAVVLNSATTVAPRLALTCLADLVGFVSRWLHREGGRREVCDNRWDGKENGTFLMAMAGNNPITSWGYWKKKMVKHPFCSFMKKWS